VALASTSGFFGGLMLGNGWWSVGIWLGILVGFGIPYVVAGFWRPSMKSDLTLTGLVLGGPFGAFVFFQILLVVADPEPVAQPSAGAGLGPRPSSWPPS
jgi:hypothetical protein